MHTRWKISLLLSESQAQTPFSNIQCSLATFTTWATTAVSNFTDVSVSQVNYSLKDIPGFCSADTVTPSRPGKGVEEGAILYETQTQ